MNKSNKKYRIVTNGTCFRIEVNCPYKTGFFNTKIADNWIPCNYELNEVYTDFSMNFILEDDIEEYTTLQAAKNALIFHTTPSALEQEWKQVYP